MNTNMQSIIVQNRSKLEQIAQNNAIKYIGLFGSYARGEQTNKSDIDLLVKFDFSKKRIGLFELYRIQNKLEELFGNKVDVVTKPNKFVKPSIETDLVTIYER